LRGQGVDLKRKTAEVSSGRVLSIEEAARKDSAVHVSLSSDSPVKQPEIWRSPLPERREPSKLESVRPKPDACSLISVSELHRRSHTPKRRRAVERLYRLGGLTLSTLAGGKTTAL